LTKSSNINFLIWCLMAIVEGSLIFFPNRCVCLKCVVEMCALGKPEVAALYNSERASYAV
jgi:hypothetical protein